MIKRCIWPAKEWEKLNLTQKISGKLSNSEIKIKHQLNFELEKIKCFFWKTKNDGTLNPGKW